MKNILLITALLSLGACESHRKHVRNNEPPEPNFDSYTQTKPLPSSYNDSNDDTINPRKFAEAQLEAKSGSNARGSVSFYETDKGILINADVYNISEGKHGIHIHEKGNCTDDDASSAGEHYNPAQLTHGDVDPLKYHKGDLGNIVVDKNGHGTLKIFISRAKLGRNINDLYDFVGKSVILHEKEDDLKSQPSGASGARIACGVIEKVIDK